jgi:hypothetical protein
MFLLSVSGDMHVTTIEFHRFMEKVRNPTAIIINTVEIYHRILASYYGYEGPTSKDNTKYKCTHI